MSAPFDPLSPDDLLAEPTPFEGHVLDPQIETLPLHDLTWPNFEKLCARLIQHRYDVRSFKYGRPGQAQEGIDVTWRLPAAQKRHVAQVKHWKQIKASDIKQWVAHFCNGKLATQTQHYILCLSIDVDDDRKAYHAWDAAEQSLAAQGIDAQLWDKSCIVELLREAPHLVQTFFSKAIKERFCNELPMPEPDSQTFRPRYVSIQDSLVTLENTTIRLELLTPTQENPRPSAILSFGRADLSGIILGLDRDEVVAWLQWVSHYQEGDAVPFAHRSYNNDQKYILSTQQSRLTLEKQELDDLIWALKQAWGPYRAAIETLEAKWQVLRFKRLHRDAGNTYGLYRISRALWRLICDYTRQHQSDDGDSPEHIFESSGSGMLKVYVPRKTSDLDAGHHLIAYVFQEGGHINGFGEDMITLGWSPTKIHGGAVQFSPRKQWNAEITHQWFAEQLIPRVLRWYERQQYQNLSWLNKLRHTLNGADLNGATSNVATSNVAPARHQLEGHFYSKAGMATRAFNEFRSARETIQSLHQMQSHFSVYQRDAAIEPALVQVATACVEELAHKLPECHHDYVRGNLGLDSRPLGEGILHLLANLEGRAGAARLEMTLRSIICCCETTHDLSDTDYRWLTHSLMPVWLRMREDMLCDMFR